MFLWLLCLLVGIWICWVVLRCVIGMVWFGLSMCFVRVSSILICLLFDCWCFLVSGVKVLVMLGPCVLVVGDLLGYYRV